MRSTTRRALDEFLARAREAAGPCLRKAVLYGSQARGDATRESDVDLLVVWDGSRWEARRVLVPIASEVLLRHGVDISIHPLTCEEEASLAKGATTFLRNVREEGVVV